MEQEKSEVSERTEKLKKWLKNPYNLIFLIIVVLAIILRIYLMIHTSGQPLWWDEAEYMSTAKHWAGIINYPHIVESRSPFFPFLAMIIFSIGLNEIWVKILIELTSSIGLVFVTFFLIKEMFNKKMALITTFIIGVFWLVLFNSLRLHTDVPVMFLQYLALLFFWKGYVKQRKYKQKSKKYLVLFSLFMILALLIKPTAGLMIITLVFFLFLTQRLTFLKSKKLWLAVILGIIFMIPYFIYGYSVSGNPIIFLQGSHVFENPTNISSLPLGLNVFSYFFLFTQWPFFALFLIGLIIALIEVGLKIDLIFKGKTKSNYGDLFMLLFIAVYLIYFVFIERQAPEDRWVMPMVIALFTLSSKALIYIYNSIKKYSKEIALIIIIILLILGAYSQLNLGFSSINSRKDSYKPVKESALWIKQNSNPQDTIMSVSYTQTSFYSERKVYSYPSDMTPESFLEFIKENKPRYLIVSVFEIHHPQWMYSMPEEFFQILKPVQVYTQNSNGQEMPVLIVYEFTGYELSDISISSLETPDNINSNQTQ